jgi:hypothetical protein
MRASSFSWVPSVCVPGNPTHPGLFEPGVGEIIQASVVSGWSQTPALRSLRSLGRGRAWIGYAN